MTHPIVVLAVTDLAVRQASESSVTLTWTGSDDGTTNPAYAVRSSQHGPITAATWDAATDVPGVPIYRRAGRVYAVDVPGLDLSERQWFAVRASNGTALSPVSNSPATLISDLRQVNVWLFNQSSYNARDRRLMHVIQPDFVHRAAYEWVGTELQDRGFDGIKQSLDCLVCDAL